jgi:SNF2 family DNA or RNA helicase
MMKLYKYQEEGVDFLRANTRCILGDQMGLGKTPQALMALEPDDYPVVVVCPASVRMVWQQEAEKWLNGVSTQAIRTGKDIVTGADITIISYSLFGTITLKRPQTLIVDEAHYCQSRSTLRTQRIAAASKGLTLWLLTGTPMWSRPRSLYPLLAMVGGWKKTYKEFAMKFCAGGYMMKPIRGRGMTRVWDDSGSSNLGELALLVQPYILRRLKSDVLKELPPKTRQIITVKHRLSKEEKEMSGFDFKSLEGGVIPAGPIATAVKETALWKMKSINQHIVDLMESVDKIIVFAWNREVMTRIQNANKRYGLSLIHI